MRKRIISKVENKDYEAAINQAKSNLSKLSDNIHFEIQIDYCMEMIIVTAIYDE